jgi:hypothetical protein
LNDPIGAIRYVDHKGRAKEVRYWFMTPVTVAFEPNDEVDEIAWVAPNAVRAQLSYGRDVDILERALEALG